MTALDRASGRIAAVLLAIMAGPSAHAACATLPTGFVLTPPANLLSKYPSGGGALSSEVRNAVTSDPSQLSAIVGLVGSATSQQRQAIGTGLGQAAAICARPEEATTRAIQQAVVTAANAELASTFQTVTGDPATTATGGAGGGAGGGGGGGSGGGTAVTANSPSGGGSQYSYTGTMITPNLINVPGTSGANAVTLTGDVGRNSLLIANPTTSISQSVP